jgi:two-component system cell cycle sensor histidine kinase/response regulator CckA
MKTYSKILLATLPLVFCLLLATVGTTYYFSRTALTELAETWLETRLSEAMKVAHNQAEMLKNYRLETIPASIAKAKLDAGQVMTTIKVGETGCIFSVDHKGIIAVHPDEAMIGKDVSKERWFKALKQARGRLVYQTSAGKHLAMVDYFAPWQWYILASDTEREVYGVADRMKPYLISLGIIGFLVMVLSLMLLTRRLTEPLRLLTLGADRIGKGDLGIRIDIASQDEFGRLALVFNQMAQKLQKTLSELQHREAHFRSLIENTSDLIAILDVKGCITFLSASIERILGYRRETVMGRQVFDFVHPDDRDDALEKFNERIKSASLGVPSEIRLLHADGSWQTMEVAGNNLLDHPAVQGLVVNAHNITKRKAAEDALQWSHNQLEERVAERTAELFKANAQLRQEIAEREQVRQEKDKLQDQLLQAQKMEAIGTLAGGIAHDFNNLLMGIQGNVDLIALDRDFNHAHGKKVKTIQDCVQSGSRLTQQLLGVARLGKYEVKITDPNDLVNKSADMFGRTRQELRITATYQKDVWAVNVDQGQIEQVLLNLLINAWQAMPEGGTINLETANEVLDDQFVVANAISPGKYVRISIADSGVGMDRATMERIFDPFFTTKAIKRGTGLGLASAYGIIRNHGGCIDVRSEPGHGATFSIYLKAIAVPVAEKAPKAKLPFKGSETILLVDDDELIIDVGQAMLKTLGYAVLTANSGNSAIALYRSHGARIALVILDMIMPDMGGGRAYDELKTIDPDVKVLLASGYSINGQATDILARGCNGFIQKPFNLQALSEKVRTVLDSSV